MKEFCNLEIEFFSRLMAFFIAEFVRNALWNTNHHTTMSSNTSNITSNFSVFNIYTNILLIVYYLFAYCVLHRISKSLATYTWLSSRFRQECSPWSLAFVCQVRLQGTAWYWLKISLRCLSQFALLQLVHSHPGP